MLRFLTWSAYIFMAFDRCQTTGYGHTTSDRLNDAMVPPFLFLREKLIQSNQDRERFQNYRYKRAEPSGGEGSGGATTSFGQYTGNGRYDGFIMELLERIRSVIRGIDFEYEVELVPDNKYGAAGSYSKIWNGMIGEVVRGTADVAAGPITVTGSRKSAVDFTYPFMASGIQAMVLHTSYVQHDPFRVIYPFSIEVWFLSLFIFILVVAMLWATNKFDPYEWKESGKEGRASEDHRKDLTFWNAMWFCTSSLFLQSSDHSPRSNAGRCIAAFWYMYVLVMVFLYIVNVQFFITSQTRYNYVRDIADVKAEKTIKYGITYKGTDTYHVFKKTKSLKSMWHKMNNDHVSPYVYNLEAGVKKVRHSNGRFALLGQSAILRYIASQRPCDVTVTGPYLNRGQYVFAVAKNSPLGEHISGALEALRDSGVLEDLERDWWDLDDRWGRCGNQTKFERDGAYSLFINDVSPVFYLLAIGAVASILVFIFEVICYKSCGKGSDNYSPKAKKGPRTGPKQRPSMQALMKRNPKPGNAGGFNGAAHADDFGAGAGGGRKPSTGGGDDANMWI